MTAMHLVRYDGSSTKVVGVKEFQVAKALLEGQTELLSQLVPSQWGPMHLFDVCLTFGYVDTAMAMAERGVRGCSVEAYHLKRKWCRPVKYDDFGSFLDTACVTCENGWQTCEGCCFGFPVEQGIWMEDWDVRLEDAAAAARKTLKQALVHAALEVFQSGAPLPFTVSEEAMVHLLDLAILTGNKEAAKRCADLSKLWPLRRWSGQNFFRVAEEVSAGRCPLAKDDWIQFYGNHYEVRCLAQLMAALSAGAQLQGLTSSCGLPLREAVLLSLDGDFGELPLPESLTSVKKIKTAFAHFFLNRLITTEVASLSKEQLQKAQKARLSLQNFKVLASLESEWWEELWLSLLDVAILTGQSDCAVLCVSLGVKLSKDGVRLLQQHLDKDPARRPAAAAAANKVLALSRKSVICEKGVAVYQVMRKLLQGRAFPALVVDEVIAFSIDVPEIVEELDLREEAKAWWHWDDYNILFHVPASRRARWDIAVTKAWASSLQRHDHCSGTLAWFRLSFRLKLTKSSFSQKESIVWSMTVLEGRSLQLAILPGRRQHVICGHWTPSCCSIWVRTSARCPTAAAAHKSLAFWNLWEGSRDATRWWISFEREQLVDEVISFCMDLCGCLQRGADVPLILEGLSYHYSHEPSDHLLWSCGGDCPCVLCTVNDVFQQFLLVQEGLYAFREALPFLHQLQGANCFVLQALLLISLANWPPESKPLDVLTRSARVRKSWWTKMQVAKFLGVWRVPQKTDSFKRLDLDTDAWTKFHLLDLISQSYVFDTFLSLHGRCCYWSSNRGFMLQIARWKEEMPGRSLWEAGMWFTSPWTVGILDVLTEI